MSRTIRRKKQTLMSQHTFGCKQFSGFGDHVYTKEAKAKALANEDPAYIAKFMVWRENLFGQMFLTLTYGYCAEATPAEKKKRIMRLHQESKDNNSYSPSNSYRNRRNKSFRLDNKAKIKRIIKSGEYEDDQFYAKPIDCWWDWS